MLYKKVVEVWREEKIEDLLENFFIKFTYCSLKFDIEEIIFRDVEAIFKGEKVINFKGDKKTIIEIENHKELCENLQQISKKNNGKLTIDHIKQFHFELMKNGCFPEEGFIKGERAGEFRRDADVLKIEEKLNLLLEYINNGKLNEDNALEGISYFICKFENLQPFLYGNGIVLRMLTNYLLLANNLAPVVFYHYDKEVYYSVLENFNTSKGMNGMVGFVKEQVYKTWVKDYNVKLKGLKDFLD